MNFYYKLDNYCIFIASRYFTSIDDFINLEKTSRRFRGNIEKFHYNPISVTDKTIIFFPFLQTLHLYDRKDPFITDEQIIGYAIWFSMEYEEYLFWKKTINKITSKRVYYIDKNRNKSITIPSEVNELIDTSFTNNPVLQQLTINHQIKYMTRECLLKCTFLNELLLPSNWKVCGNVIMIEDTHLRSVLLPSSIRTINKTKYLF